MLPSAPPQNLSHLGLCSVKGGAMVDGGGSPAVHCSGHYIMSPGSVATVDYGSSPTTTTNLGMWDTPQIVSANHVTSDKKVRENFVINNSNI